MLDDLAFISVWFSKKLNPATNAEQKARQLSANERHMSTNKDHVYPRRRRFR
jgi:hypothetical protein